jgi:hypothetical protein
MVFYNQNKKKEGKKEKKMTHSCSLHLMKQERIFFILRKHRPLMEEDIRFVYMLPVGGDKWEFLDWIDEKLNDYGLGALGTNPNDELDDTIMDQEYFVRHEDVDTDHATTLAFYIRTGSESGFIDYLPCI